MNKISFGFREKIHTIEFNDKLSPTTTVLQYLRENLKTTGVKEGCAEGDCGACTIVLAENINGKLHYKAFNSCVMLLPQLHGKYLITAEDLAENDNLHPIQVAIIQNYASQCGFCTPGFTMSLFAQIKEHPNSSYEELVDAITGNLCRCTGYRSIRDAAKSLVGKNIVDKFNKKEKTIIQLLNSIEKNQTISIKTTENQYFIPFIFEEALKLKKQFPNAQITAGSTDLVLKITKKNQKIPIIIDISNIEELKNIAEDKNYIYVGAGVKIEDLRYYLQDKMPELAGFLKLFGAKQIRNAASVGGNIATASPIGDLSMALMTLEAKVILANSSTRQLSLDDFIIGYRQTALKPDEIIKRILIPKTSENQIIKFFKISKRQNLDISTVSAGFKLDLADNKIKNIRIVYGGMAEKIKHASETEQFLKNKIWNSENIYQAMEILEKEFTPIDDARSSAQARRIMAKNLLLKFYQQTTEK